MIYYKISSTLGRHWRDKRQEAGYHHLDRSRLAERDVRVQDMRELEETVASYKG